MAIFFSVVPEYQRVVHFRLGRLIAIKGPGFVFPIWPIIDATKRVDLREIFVDVEHQTCITQDNAPVSVDMLMYLRVINPDDSVIKVQDVLGASRGMAVTTLRAVIGDIPLDDVLAKRDLINQIMQVKLDEVTERWGVKVTAVEIREILPPRDIQEAMSRQMSAERHRRAMVLEADGQRESAIKVAEGQKASEILKAEGDKQARILEAQGQREAAILEAEGLSLALRKISETAREVDNNTMALQYLETLREMGDSPSTKWVFPLEFTNLIRPFTAMTGGDGDSPPGRRNIPPKADGG
jgi:regulator of protease activity HflC (stomatin/prohibitin superfamily)